MVDEKRKQLMNQLLQLQGPAQAALSSKTLSRTELLPFFRKVEECISDQNLLNCSIMYWSSTDASWAIPERANLQALSQSAMACSVFSEHRQDPSDEFCFALLSKELSVAVYGSYTDAIGTDSIYQCLGTFDSSLSKRVCQAMSPYWEFIDPLEADKIEGAIKHLGSCQTSQHFINSLGHEWAELNSASSKSLVQVAEQARSGPDPVAKHSKSSRANSNASGQSETSSSKSVDLWGRIANDYPYPIANPYRTLESITNVSEKYKEQLRLVENLLALLAGLSLAVCAQNEPKVLSDLKDCVVSGVSVGHWRELIRKCTVAWKASSTKDIPLAKAITALKIEQVEKGFGKTVEQLVRARNDFAHHRAPTAESQLEKETLRLAELLRDGIVHTDFLCEFPIKIVKAIDVLPTGTIKMTCLKAIGDHPALRQEELCLSRGFPKGHLITNAGNSNWLSLYPFLSQEICPSCGTMEIYLLDKWKYDKNLMQVRSFERGHTQESSAISDSLKAMVLTINR